MRLVYFKTVFLEKWILNSYDQLYILMTADYEHKMYLKTRRKKTLWVQIFVLAI